MMILRLFLLFGLLLSASATRAESLHDFLPNVLENHDRLNRELARVRAAEQDVEVAWGSWYPEMELTGSYGRERQNKQSGTADTTYTFREAGLEVTQLITDFGKTNAEIDVARAKLDRAKLKYRSERQELIADAAETYIELTKAWKVRAYAMESERNITRQTGMEEIRVDSGGGVSSDVLQSKTQLAGAKARRIQADGKLEEARNDFKEVFGFIPDDLARLKAVAFSGTTVEDLSRLERAQEVARDKNLKIRLSENKILEAEANYEKTRSDVYGPEVNFVASGTHKQNTSGTYGNRMEKLWKVEFKLPFNLGFTSRNDTASALADVDHSKRDLDITSRKVEREVANARQRLKTAQLTHETLQAQVGIAEQFLDLSRQEREAGQRSLIDVLSGETALINARSDAEAAKADVAIAIISLKKSLGELDTGFFREMVD